MFPLDYRSFTAYRLARIEKSVPDAHTRERKCSLESPFHADKESPSDRHGHQSRYDRSHRKHFPFTLKDEQTYLPAETHDKLSESSGIFYFFVIRLHIRPQPIFSMYFATNSSALPSPPSSFWFIDRRISSIELLPKNSYASFTGPK